MRRAGTAPPGPRPGRGGSGGAASSSAAPGPGGAPGSDPRPGRPGPTPSVAREIFGAALPLAERYADMLATDGIVRGLIGPREAGRLWDRHLLNCAVVAALVPTPATLLDIGSGAGLPGVVLAMLRPDVQVTLLEPMARRVTFLEECVAALGLRNARAYRGRAEEVRGQFAADVVTARAVAPLDRLAGLAVPLVRPGGEILALKGERAAEEAAAAAPALRKLGVAVVEVLAAGTGQIDPVTTVIRLTAGERDSRRRGG